MRGRIGFLALVAVSAALAWQRVPRRFLEEKEVPIPPDAREVKEFYFSRLRYQNFPGTGMWAARGNWAVDSPKADRQFMMGVRRLTRIDNRIMERVVDLVSDDVFLEPWLYAVESGHWDLPESQARKLREYLDRGGFLMTDDFHGTYEWSVMMASMRRVFPDREPVDLPNDDPIFHVLYDLSERVQVPGVVMFYTGHTYEYDGFEPKWRAIRDNQGRIVVAICHNQDNGDAWEWADAPEYPERYASQAYRLGINYIIYSMTH